MLHSEKMDKPPFCNTGAGNTGLPPLRACVDWFQVTFILEKKCLFIFDLLNLKKDYFLESNGQYGYKKSYNNNGISIMYDGSESMGVHLQLSGKGCRYLENHSEGFDWFDFFKKIDSFEEYNISRIDIALDDFNRLLDINFLRKKIKKGECRSRFELSRNMETVRLSNGESLGTTLYFGQPTSRLQIRFYEKSHEMTNKGFYHGFDHWNRYELQLRKQRALNMFGLLLESDQKKFADTVKGILSYYITFTNRNEQKNKSRWPVYKKWEKFIGEVEKIKLTKSEAEKDIFDAVDWIFKQVSPTLAMITKSGIIDIEEILNDGMIRLEDKHIKKVENYLIKKERLRDAQLKKKYKLSYGIFKISYMRKKEKKPYIRAYKIQIDQ